jgi:hypothetical protein
MIHIVCVRLRPREPAEIGGVVVFQAATNNDRPISKLDQRDAVHVHSTYI